MTNDAIVGKTPRPFALSSADAAIEGDNHPVYGNVTWRTLISCDRTPSRDLVLGVATFEPRGWLGQHRHEPAEFYFGLSGEGTATIDGIEFKIAPGVAIYIPGNAEHGVIAGDAGLSFAYGFAVNSFAEIEYRYSAEPADQEKSGIQPAGYANEGAAIELGKSSTSQ